MNDGITQVYLVRINVGKRCVICKTIFDGKSWRRINILNLSAIIALFVAAQVCIGLSPQFVSGPDEDKPC